MWLLTTHVAHVASEFIGIALTGPQFDSGWVVELFIDVIQLFVFIIPEHWDAILNELWCYRSGQLPPQGLT